MQPVRIAISRLASNDLPLPEYATGGASGMDLQAAIERPLVMDTGCVHLVPCGFVIAVPEGFEAQVRPRSGLAARSGITVLNAPGTIDSDYRGEIKVLLVNHGATPFTVERGMRIAQLVVAPVAKVEWDVVGELPQTPRGSGGFGHTGS